MSTNWLPSLWLDSFVELLREVLDYGDQWSLNFSYSQTDTISKEERKRGWKVYKHHARGKFCCGSCSKTWSSVRATVLFRYRLRSEAGRGTVIMRPFRQACRCCQDDEFVLPGFSQTEVEEALHRLFRKIRKNCYGEEEEDGSVCSNKKRTKPHENNLCEACRLGICSQDN